MKYQRLTSMGTALLGTAATASAGLLDVRAVDGQCPAGYSPTVYYITVTPTSSATPTAEPTITPSSSSSWSPASPPAAFQLTSGGQCPSGYSPSVYYITVTPTSSTTPIAEPTTTATPSSSTSSSSSSSSTSSPSPVAVDTTTTPTYVSTTTPAGDSAAETSTSSTPAPAPTSETLVPETTEAAAPTTTSTTATPVVQTQAPTTTTSVEDSTSAASVAEATSASSAASASSTAAVSSGSTSGEATFYGGNVAGGTCSFSGYTLPASIFGTALSVDQWADAGKCGACVAVKGPGGNTIKAMIVDQCPSCNANHFDLFEDAFSSLSALAAGVIDIEWSYTSCDLDGPLKVRNKDGTSEYWFSMQVVNANEPVTALEVSTDGGSSWQATTRTSYNYFEKESGFRTDTVDVRVTGESGNTVTVKNVGCSSSAEFTAESNL